jgi:hypothetical protein
MEIIYNSRLISWIGQGWFRFSEGYRLHPRPIGVSCVMLCGSKCASVQYSFKRYRHCLMVHFEVHRGSVTSDMRLTRAMPKRDEVIDES